MQGIPPVAQRWVDAIAACDFTALGAVLDSAVRFRRTSGQPREFRTRLGQIPVGHVLEVGAADASARENLPALARLLGHRVEPIEPGADGQLRIRVERAQWAGP